MDAHAAMPVPPGDLTPRQLCEEIYHWARVNGYFYEEKRHASEYARVVIRDRAGGVTSVVIPNPHHGRKLRKDQVGYVVRALNRNWRP